MSVLVSSPSVSTLVGTPKEVKARLGRSQAEQVLVLAFDHIKPAAFKALAENFTNVASSMFEVSARADMYESRLLSCPTY